MKLMSELREKGARIRVGNSLIEFTLNEDEQSVVITFKSEVGYDMTIPKSMAQEIPPDRIVEDLGDKVTIKAEPMVDEFRISFTEFAKLYLSLYGFEEKFSIRAGSREIVVETKTGTPSWGVRWKVSNFREKMRTIFFFTEFNVREVAGILRKFKQSFPFVPSHLEVSDLYVRVYPSEETVEFFHKTGEVQIRGINYHKLFSHIQFYVFSGVLHNWFLKDFGLIAPKDGKDESVVIDGKRFSRKVKNLLVNKELNEVLLKAYFLML